MATADRLAVEYVACPLPSSATDPADKSFT
jgi:hypothetical protein